MAPTWDLLEKIAPKSYNVANGHLMHNLRLWTELADQGNVHAVLEDPESPAQLVHVSPVSSPFHNIDRNSWYAHQRGMSHRMREIEVARVHSYAHVLSHSACWSACASEDDTATYYLPNISFRGILGSCDCCRMVLPM